LKINTRVDIFHEIELCVSKCGKIGS
jgi:hypothetical protein